MRKKIIPFFMAILIVIAIGVTGCEGITSPPAQKTTGEASGGQNTGIWVSGTGEVNVTPDIAVLQVGIEAQETTVAAAQAKAADAINNIMAALTGGGVKSEDIQTQYFTIRQRTRWDEARSEEVITGYRVTNTVTAKIRVLPVESYTLDYKASNIIDAVVKAGGDLIRIDDLNFTVEDPSAYYDEAREKATVDARAKARKLADQMGIRLGEPTFVSESAYMPSAYQGMVYALSEGPIPAPAPAPASISPGEVKVTLTVQVAYSIR